MADPQLILKTTPPRAHRMAVIRPRLQAVWDEVNDRTTVAVCGPRGFGKTTLLVQWRRHWLKRGALVGWVTLDEQDAPERFATALLHAMRVASGRPAFDTIAGQYAGQPDRALDMLTGLLSEIASLAAQTVLFLDEAERLPEHTVRESLTYLLYNAPPNLRLVIGSRTMLPLPTADLAAHGNFATLKGPDLRLELDESIEILGKRFGPRLSIDDSARLHEITEGWPIGLQLAIASIERERDLHTAIDALSARHGDIERYFLESLVARLPVPVVEFLTRIAILDDLSPELCAAVAGTPFAGEYLSLLARETPIVMVAEGKDWIRLHPMARDFALGGFEKLPQGEQHALHRIAAHWLAERGSHAEAARHALASGDAALARSLAGRCLFGLIKEGRLGEARAWLEKIPEHALADDARLQLDAAWTMALGERPALAQQITERVMRDVDAPDTVRFEAALIYSCAAGYADRPGTIAAVMERWPEPPAGIDDRDYLIAHANTLALLALYRGATDTTRQIEARALIDPGQEPQRLAYGLGLAFVATSHLWDGNPVKAEELLRHPLERAERYAGRRSVVAAILSAVLAAAVCERGHAAHAQALLANRLDVVERSGMPDAIVLAYGALSSLAQSQGDERRALDVLASLQAFGESARMPRLAMTSLAEQIRLHAWRSRTETVAALLAALDGMAAVFAEPDYAVFQPLYELKVAIAKAYAGLANLDFDAASSSLKRADSLAAQLNYRRAELTIKVLRAVVAHRRGDTKAFALLSEATGLAAIGGIERLLADTHPLAETMAKTAQAGAAASAHAPLKFAEATPDARPAPPPLRRPVIPLGGLLTPKEAEVLHLLTSGMSNKLIAKTMDISDETVKWHLKNLFSKLSAGTRKHAVDRARLLGLIAA